MRILLMGGSGQVGTILRREFTRRGDEVIVATRRPSGAGQVAWDGRCGGAWTDALEGSDAVINLCGRSVNCRYNERNRKEIMDSRVDSTRAIGRAIAAARRPPRIWLQSSTATIYAHRYDAPNDEFSGQIGGREPNTPDTWRFSIDVARAWEQEAVLAETPRTRKVLMRSAMVMSPDRGGIFDVLLTLVRRGLGGAAGDGRQFVSWIHEMDFVAATLRLLTGEHLDGPINLASPNPLSNAEFMRILRSAAGVRVGLPATRWMLEIGALLMRTETELILKSRRVVPGKLLRDGFDFRFPEWAGAASDLVNRWRT